MEVIPFPTQYKKPLLAGKKNTTIRIGAERGKYKKGKTYRTGSYAGKDWGVAIKVTEVIPTTVEKLGEFGIPKGSIQGVLKEKGISLQTRADLVRFKIL